MGKRCKDPGVKCPYYCSEDKQHLYCEGVEQENWIHLAWGSAERKKDYKKRRCKRDWERCPIARCREQEED